MTTIPTSITVTKSGITVKPKSKGKRLNLAARVHTCKSSDIFQAGPNYWYVEQSFRTGPFQTEEQAKSYLREDAIRSNI